MLEHIFRDEQDSELWFQQDGAPAHTSRMAMGWLNLRLQNQLISNKCEFSWPARSPDLSPLDFYLWSYVKGIVFRSNPLNVADLKAKVRESIRAIPADSLKRVIENFKHRLSLRISASGGHFENK